MQILLSIRPALPAIFLLITLIQFNFHILPLYWPDEALFSSPAAQLAASGSFSSPVLYGLIPGMDQATLWNSPFFMVLLSGMYSLAGGESLEWARGLPMILGILSIIFFSANLQFFVSRFELSALLPVILVMDPVFQRAANTARMDILALCFFLISHYFLLQDFSERKYKNTLKYSFIAGIFTGLAGLSHPFAVFFTPVLLIYLLPDIKKIFTAALGVLLGISPWLFYIIPNISIFKVQFLSQLSRKSDIFYIWGGETGGILKVFFSQYGNAWIMAAGFLVFSFAITAGILYLWKIRKHWKDDLFFRLFFSFLCIFGAALVTSEGWYALYAGPFLILTTLHLSDSALLDLRLRYKLQINNLNHLPLVFLSIFFITSTSLYLYKNHIKNNTTAVVKSFIQTSINQVRPCTSVYLRVRPDPYFFFRKQYPKMEVLEFIPGKLQFKGRDASLFKRYNEIQCFFIDSNDAWEPVLTEYLKQNKDLFEQRSIYFALPVGNARLFIRKH